MFLTWLAVTAIFGAVYLLFMVLFFLGFGRFEELLRDEARLKDKEDASRRFGFTQP